MSRLKTMDNKNNIDWSVTSIKTVRENIMQNEKNIRKLEKAIQSIVFARIYEKRMNIKVWKYFIIVKILVKQTTTFHSIKSELYKFK